MSMMSSGAAELTWRHTAGPRHRFVLRTSRSSSSLPRLTSQARMDRVQGIIDNELVAAETDPHATWARHWAFPWECAAQRVHGKS